MARRCSSQEHQARGQQEGLAVDHLAAVVPLLAEVEAIVVAGKAQRFLSGP